MSNIKESEMIKLTPEEEKSLQGMVEEVVNAKYKIDAYNDFIKDVKKRVKHELKFPVKRFNKIVNVAKEKNANELEHEMEEILFLAEKLGFYKRENM